MKTTGILLLILVGLNINTQATKFKFEIHQHGEKIKILKNEANLEKAPFQLVFAFKSSQSWRLVSGNNDVLKELINADVESIGAVLSNAAFGGAYGYFNEDKSIKAYNEEVYTSLEYKDDEHHTFDSIYKKGKWIYGVRTVEKLSTKNEALLIEDWKSDKMYLTFSNAVIMDGNQQFSNGKTVQLNFKEVKLSNPLDVRGKTYEEIGESVYQEGCEGCGNLAIFHFLSNGKQVDFLLSGSDTGSFSTYHQNGNRISIGNDLVYTVSQDGSYIQEVKTGFKYFLKKP